MDNKEQDKNIDISGRVVSSEEMPKLDQCSGEMQQAEKDGSAVHPSVSSSMHAHGDQEQESRGVSDRMINNTGGDKYNNQQTDADAASS